MSAALTAVSCGLKTMIHGGVAEHLMYAAGGVTWMILVFFVPMLVVSTGLMVWQLYARRGESLGSSQAWCAAR